MAKKKIKKSSAPPSSSPVKMEGVSKRGWKTIGGGILIAALGYYVLSLTDPAGQNWASKLSPFLILGGYAAMAVGIILPNKNKVLEDPPKSPPLDTAGK